MNDKVKDIEKDISENYTMVTIGKYLESLKIHLSKLGIVVISKDIKPALKEIYDKLFAFQKEMGDSDSLMASYYKLYAIVYALKRKTGGSKKALNQYFCNVLNIKKKYGIDLQTTQDSEVKAVLMVVNDIVEEEKND